MLFSVRNAVKNPDERFELDLPAELEPMDYMGAVSFRDIRLKGEYFCSGGMIRFRGELSVICTFECDRCLTNFDRPYTFCFDETYSLEAEEEQYRIDKNDFVDLHPLVNDTILSSLPIERLCREDCKGLCPHCGIDKNFSSCSCEENEKDNPFEALRGLVD